MLNAARCLAWRMRAFSTNSEPKSPNWFADHLYVSDFLIICHRPPCLFTATTRLERNIYSCEKRASPAVLWLHCPYTSIWWSCLKPFINLLHSCKCLASSLMLITNISEWYYIFKLVMMRKMSAKPPERTGLEKSSPKFSSPFRWPGEENV